MLLQGTRHRLRDLSASGRLVALKSVCPTRPLYVLRAAAVQANLNYSRDHTIAEGLDYMTVWNMAGLQVSQR